jgi:hypothetical protein
MSDEYTSSENTDNFDSDLPQGEQADKNTQVRKRIDALMEKKRLKEMLDDSDDWTL